MHLTIIHFGNLVVRAVSGDQKHISDRLGVINSQNLGHLSFVTLNFQAVQLAWME